MEQKEIQNMWFETKGTLGNLILKSKLVLKEMRSSLSGTGTKGGIPSEQDLILLSLQLVKEEA